MNAVYAGKATTIITVLAGITLIITCAARIAPFISLVGSLVPFVGSLVRPVGLLVRPVGSAVRSICPVLFARDSVIAG